VHRVDDLGVVDALQVGRRDPEIGEADLRWMMLSGTPSPAISIAWA
jgi:hypothetical protein